MADLLTSAQMRAIESAAIDAGHATGLELMERAGRGVVEAILDWRPTLGTAPHRAVVLCGPGNNGGDGFVIARILRDRGWHVDVFLYGEPASLPSDAATNAARWRDRVQAFETDPLGGSAEHADIVIDALFGTGLTRPLGRDLWACLAGIEACLPDAGRIVAVDAPSGLCLDSGRWLDAPEEPPRADLTVTFHRLKRGHVLADGPAACGTLRCIDIGLDGCGREMSRRALINHHDLSPGGRGLGRVVARSAERPTFLVDPSDQMYPGDARHKYDHGHALILSGGPGRGGAARLAARGALRIGAGLVTVGCPPAALAENAARLDAIMLTELPDADRLCVEIVERKVAALCLGPGFGLGHRLRGFAAAVLETGLPVVLDADALSEYCDSPERLFSMVHPSCVLTPHQGEFGRLFPDLLEKLRDPALRGPAYSKVDATRAAAVRAGCTVLFKGADTVIANPQGHASIHSAYHDRAAPGLATAGSGDVLTGFITGLLARGMGPMQAAESAVWLHVDCARRFGPGLIAEDLSEQLPGVLGELAR